MKTLLNGQGVAAVSYITKEVTEVEGKGKTGGFALKGNRERGSFTNEA